MRQLSQTLESMVVDSLRPEGARHAATFPRACSIAKSHKGKAPFQAASREETAYYGNMEQ